MLFISFILPIIRKFGTLHTLSPNVDIVSNARLYQDQSPLLFHLSLNLPLGSKVVLRMQFPELFGIALS